VNIQNVGDVRQIEIHITEPLVPGPSHLKVEIVIAKMKKYKTPGSDQILVELIQAGGETLVSVIHKLINSVWNKELPDQLKESIIVPVHKKGDKNGCNNYHLHTNIIECPSSSLGAYIDEIIGDHQCGF
jgi:hypothetical protein